MASDGNNQAAAIAAKRAIATATGVAGNKEGNGDGGKSNCNRVKGGKQAMMIRAMVMAMARMWEMAMAIWVAGDKKGNGEGGKGDDNGNEGCG
jgi:hypothetical protein